MSLKRINLGKGNLTKNSTSKNQAKPKPAKPPTHSTKDKAFKILQEQYEKRFSLLTGVVNSQSLFSNLNVESACGSLSSSNESLNTPLPPINELLPLTVSERRELDILKQRCAAGAQNYERLYYSYKEAIESCRRKDGVIHQIRANIGKQGHIQKRLEAENRALLASVASLKKETEEAILRSGGTVDASKAEMKLRRMAVEIQTERVQKNLEIRGLTNAFIQEVEKIRSSSCDIATMQNDVDAEV